MSLTYIYIKVSLRVAWLRGSVAPSLREELRSNSAKQSQEFVIIS
ncbi:hypothetical protein [Rickettsia hoogstraalii]|nr:hypothetical protein [Rickettsia hoogstraalii]